MLLLSALATNSFSPVNASAIGVEPMGAAGSREVRMDSVILGALAALSITLTVFAPAFVTKRRPSSAHRTSLGCEPTLTRARSFIVPGSSKLTLAPPQFATARILLSGDREIAQGR